MQLEISHEHLGAEEIYALQSRRLRELVLRCWERVPFYRRRWEEAGILPSDIREASDIKKLPFVTKQDIADNLAECPPFGDFQGDCDAVRIQASTGSTGTPKPIFHTKADWENIGVLWARRFKAQNVGKGDVAQVAFAYSLFVVGFAASEGLMRSGALVVPTGTGAVTSSERQLEIATKWGTTVLCCTGSYMLRLADVAERMGIDCRRDLAVRTSIHGAEPLTASMREEIDARWGCTAYDSYGSVETSAPMYECQFRNGHHICQDAYMYEILDQETGEDAKPGELGEIVVTTLFKEAAPFVRYRIGDTASFLPGDCECGRTFHRMSQVKGRVDQMIKVKGVAVYPTDFEAALEKFSCFNREYLVVLRREQNRDVIDLRVEYSGSSDDEELYRVDLTKEVRNVTGLGCSVQIIPRGQLERDLAADQRTKYSRLLDLRYSND